MLLRCGMSDKFFGTHADLNLNIKRGEMDVTAAET